MRFSLSPLAMAPRGLSAPSPLQDEKGAYTPVLAVPYVYAQALSKNGVYTQVPVAKGVYTQDMGDLNHQQELMKGKQAVLASRASPDIGYHGLFVARSTEGQA